MFSIVMIVLAIALPPTILVFSGYLFTLFLDWFLDWKDKHNF